MAKRDFETLICECSLSLRDSRNVWHKYEAEFVYKNVLIGTLWYSGNASACESFYLVDERC